MYLFGKRMHFRLTLLSLCVVGLSGCAALDNEPVKPDQLPDQIIKQPQQNDYARARVGVLVFESPDYAENTGRLAAELLFNALLQRNLFAELMFIRAVNAPGLERTLFELGEEKQLDLLVTGEVSYYLEGGNFQPSRVCESIRVLEPTDHESLQQVWQAKSCERSAARETHDLLLFRTPAKPADPCVELMQAIARKFAAMLEFVPDRTLQEPGEEQAQ